LYPKTYSGVLRIQTGRPSPDNTSEAKDKKENILDAAQPMKRRSAKKKTMKGDDE